MKRVRRLKTLWKEIIYAEAAIAYDKFIFIFRFSYCVLSVKRNLVSPL